jgi:hypothetical protein
MSIIFPGFAGFMLGTKEAWGSKRITGGWESGGGRERKKS